MAGNYPDYIDNRMAYHLDGTVGRAWRVGGASVVLSPTQMAWLNDESDSQISISDLGGYTSDNPSYWMALVFPEPRDLSGFFSALAYGGSSTGDAIRICQVSTDTTNGDDGTWTAITGQTWNFSGTTVVAPSAYRQGTIGVTNHDDVTNIRGIRFGMYKNGSSLTISWDFKALHLFGKIAGTGQRLELWHPTLDQRVGAAYFDWGNAPRATSATRDFRVKNRSPTLTANSVSVSLVNSTDPSPSYTSAHDFSIGSGYAPTQSLGNLAPGAISSVVTLRRTLGIDQPVGVWATILKAQASSWT